ncbi:MAG: hypothetical protein Q7K29_08405 [Thermoleophilia bacterium]|nr:hypothetical protein [Thermoleophilia bacterium]
MTGSVGADIGKGVGMTGNAWSRRKDPDGGSAVIAIIAEDNRETGIEIVTVANRDHQ